MIGKAFEGYSAEHGGNSKPVAFPSEAGDSDLLVLATSQTTEIRYLVRAGINAGGVPVFEDRGTVELQGLNPAIVTFHSPIIITPDERARTMLLATTLGLVVLHRTNPGPDAPLAYRFLRFISGKNVPAALYGFTEIVTGRKGERYVLDNPGSFRLFALRGGTDSARLGSDFIDLRDQHGIYRPKGVTDVRTAPHWGVHRAVRWRLDPDRQNRYDFVVGTDPGHLYLLQSEDLNDPSDYQRHGPLEDLSGSVIKIHNRVFPAPIDYWRRGVEDLLVIGADVLRVEMADTGSVVVDHPQHISA